MMPLTSYPQTAPSIQLVRPTLTLANNTARDLVDQLIAENKVVTTAVPRAGNRPRSTYRATTMLPRYKNCVFPYAPRENPPPARRGGR
jgi:hypothetical protein